MASGIGAKSTLVIAEETTYGTLSAAAGILLGIESESISNSRNTIISEEINPNRAVTAIRAGNVAAAGQIATELSPTVLGLLFKHLLMPTYTPVVVTPTAVTNSMAVTRGQYVSSNSRSYLCVRAGAMAANAATVGLTSTDTSATEQNGTAMFQYVAPVATTIYRHTMAAGTNKPVGGLSAERKLHLDTGAQYFRYVGGRVNSLGITVPQEGIVKANWDIAFLDLDSQSGTTSYAAPVSTPDDPVVGIQAGIRLKLAGGSYADDFSIETANINLSNNFDTNLYTIGNSRRRDIVEGRRSCGGSISYIFEDITKFNYYKNENVVGVEFSFHHNGQFIKIEFPTTKLAGGNPTPQISGNGVVKASCDFTAFAASGSEVTVELVNLTAAY